MKTIGITLFIALSLFLILSSFFWTRKTEFNIVVTFDTSADNEQIKKTGNILKARLAAFAYAPELSFEGSSVTMKIKSNKDSLLLKQLLSASGDFQIYETYSNEETIYGLFELDKKILSSQKETNVDSLDNKSMNLENKNRLILAKLIPYVDYKGTSLIRGPVCGLSAAKDTAVIDSILEHRDNKNFFPENLQFMWSAVTQEKETHFLYAVKKTTSKNVINNTAIQNAKIEKSQYGGSVISIEFKPEFHALWQKITGYNMGKALAMVIDGKVFCAPNVIAEIRVGKSSIASSMSIEEAQVWTVVLNNGPLPAKVVSVNMNSIKR